MDIIHRHQSSESLILFTEKIENVALLLNEVNTLIAYPRRPDEIVAWAKVILEISPDFEVGKLQFVIRQFQLCNIIWDKDMGIQNIVMHLKRVIKTESGYEFTEKIKP